MWEKPVGPWRCRNSLRMNEFYQEQYKLTKDKPRRCLFGRQFDFAEALFGKFDLFCRLPIKLIDVFSTIQQFRAQGAQAEGMEPLLSKIKFSSSSRKRSTTCWTTTRINLMGFWEFNVRWGAGDVLHTSSTFI